MPNIDNTPTKSKRNETQVLAIVSGKGGTGKSIITASIGYLLAHCGFKTLIVDLDLFTSGLTFYSLADYPRQSSNSLRDIFDIYRETRIDSESLIYNIDTINIPNPFCEQNLYLTPAISTGKRNANNLSMIDTKIKIEELINILQRVIEFVIEQKDFEYVILDTRGGGDITSIGAALAAGAFIIVTEGDKTSWDVGGVLIDRIYETNKILESNQGYNNNLISLGFILNKNVLPSEAIEAFLRRNWGCPSLTTIPLDREAIRYFQEDTVPVAVDITCDFSRSILPLIRKIFVSKSWSSDSLEKLEKLEKEAEKYAYRQKRYLNTKERSKFLITLLRVYGTLISTSLLAYLAWILIKRQEQINSSEIILIIVPIILIFFMTVSDPEVLESLIPGSYRRKNRK